MLSEYDLLHEYDICPDCHHRGLEDVNDDPEDEDEQTGYNCHVCGTYFRCTEADTHERIGIQPKLLYLLERAAYERQTH